MVGEGSGSQGPKHHRTRERWDVDYFLKNDGHLFYGSSNPKVALEWTEPWVRVATVVM